MTAVKIKTQAENNITPYLKEDELEMNIILKLFAFGIPESSLTRSSHVKKKYFL